jgi:hypothetical protein
MIPFIFEKKQRANIAKQKSTDTGKKVKSGQKN